MENPKQIVKKREHPGKIEKNIRKSIKFIYYLYGERKSFDFYRSMLKKLLLVFYDKEMIEFIFKFNVEPLIVPPENLIYNPIEDDLNSFQRFTDVEGESFNIINILATVITYDFRESLCLFYVLGMLPWFKDTQEFTEYYQIHFRFVNDQAASALTRIKDDITEGNLVNSNESLSEVRRYFALLRLSNSFDILRHNDGRLVTSGTDIYKLMRIIALDKLRENNLSWKEFQLVRVLAQSYRENFSFYTYDELSDILDINKKTIYLLAGLVLRKHNETNEQFSLFEYLPDGRTYTLSETSVQAKIIALISNHKSYLNSQFLNKKQKKYLKLFFSLKENDFFPSYGVIAKAAKSTKAQVDHTMKEALIRLQQTNKPDPDYYLDKNLRELDSDSHRRTLLRIYQRSDFRALFNDLQLATLDLYMTRDERIFTYTLQEIAQILEVEGNNPVAIVEARIERIIKIFRKDFKDNVIEA